MEASQISKRIYSQEAPQGKAFIAIISYLTKNLIRYRNFTILSQLLLNHIRLFALSKLRYWGKKDFYSEIRLWNNILGLITIDKQWIKQYRLEYPQDINQFIGILKQTFCTDSLKVLEIGSGPISKLRYGIGDFELYCLDPLASEYIRLHKIVKMKANFTFIQGTCEELCRTFRKELFHMVYACNSLDHTEDPALCLESMYSVLKPYGLLYVESHESEGSHIAWYGLHKYDLVPRNSDLYLASKDGKGQNLTERFRLKKIYFRRKTEARWFSLVWQKIPEEMKEESR